MNGIKALDSAATARVSNSFTPLTASAKALVFGLGRSADQEISPQIRRLNGMETESRLPHRLLGELALSLLNDGCAHCGRFPLLTPRRRGLLNVDGLYGS